MQYTRFQPVRADRTPKVARKEEGLREFFGVIPIERGPRGLPGDPDQNRITDIPTRCNQAIRPCR